MTAVKCPNCSNEVSWNRESKFRPFCSERCKMIDLGAWASGGYSIAGPEVSEVDTSADASKLTH